jgi:hypothetical protein
MDQKEILAQHTFQKLDFQRWRPNTQKLHGHKNHTTQTNKSDGVRHVIWHVILLFYYLDSDAVGSDGIR